MIILQKDSYTSPARDDIIINTPWKFDIMQVQTRFDIWQGDADMNVPVNQGKYQAEQLPNSILHILNNKGHMFLLEEWKDVLSELLR